MKTSLALATTLLVTSLLSGCTLRLISDYDPETDQGVSALQADVTAHLARLDRLSGGPGGRPQQPQCQFENFADAYAGFAARAHVLKVRNEVRDQNQLTITQLGLLEQNLGEGLVVTHRDAEGGCLTHGTIMVTRELMDQMFRAILKLELAKKQFRGG